MFDFIFRRKSGAPVLAPTVALPAVKNPDTTAVRKQAALAAAEALGEEAAAVEFILQCEFADARAIAARHVLSQPMLQRLLPPMRKTDRRVARLLQQRLETIAQLELTARAVDACLQQAQRLLDEPHLLPNQVADLDRGWLAIAAVEHSQHAQYQAVRTALEARLLAQAALQRSAIDTLARLRQLQQTVAAADPLPPAAEITRALAILEGAMANHLAAPEAASLPRHFHSDFEQQRADFRATWQQAQQRDDACAARRQALAAWEAAAPETLAAAELMSAWRALPALDDGALERQFQALLEKLGAPHKSAQRAPRQDVEQARQQAQEMLQTLEAALQQGALQDAIDCDHALRALDAKSALPAAQTGRLNAARAELARLRGWAKWGGNVSRAELLKAAQELPGQALPAPELAKQVGALRAHWKALDASAGAAAKELWQQFDAACTAAYVPVADYFRRQAEQRRDNLVQAEALLVQIAEYAAALQGADPAVTDWKAAAAFYTRMQQAWHRLGNLERKEKKRLDRAFEAALQTLRQPLALQQAAAADDREQLIAAALALDPAARETPDAVRALQQRWQQMAQALPLERLQEQQLWQRFRAACDALFAQRKQAAAGAEQQRRHHLQQKEALCQTLEAALGQPPAAMRRAIAQTQAAWTRIGAVPRTQERPIEQRRQSALAALLARLEQGRRATLAAGFEALCAKLALCQTLEQEHAAGRAPSVAQAAAQARWQALAGAGAAGDGVRNRTAAAFRGRLCSRYRCASHVA